MLFVSCQAYFANAVPGCIGAKRLDRLPRYLQRSVLLSSSFLLPSLVLQFFSVPIMRATGVPGDVAEAVGGFTRVMVAFGCLQILDNHMYVFFANMGYVKCVSCTSLFTGLGVHMSCTYLFLFVFQWGARGAALVQVC